MLALTAKVTNFKLGKAEMVEKPRPLIPASLEKEHVITAEKKSTSEVQVQMSEIPTTPASSHNVASKSSGK